ncbi:shikimate dehydrogenase [Candidatus Woesebacteria bacterium RIFCSPHIGHO2_01_FULL_44_10]|nr:MAG: shikimate dehydrogenase [Candidatus Woesebacteria bacterium RIFCSPHIGHO2_01_FULL_44_10]OGM54367.1 MAG: shikimate dehydrogenase [Candidatus Woesebacteria bacterium RIFCSPHIGHO2_12_FULL_44_11]
MVITALIGLPVEHSVSPTLFSIYAKSSGLEYSHLKIDVRAKNLKNALEASKTLNFSGLNVTLPYKMDVIRYLDHVDKEALKIGAVNTIVNKKGKLYGFNTDSYGAIESIKDHSKIVSREAVVLGTGGAARALVAGLLAGGCTRVVVAYRRPKSIRTKGIMKDFKGKVEFITYHDKNLIEKLAEANIVCNATSCGMAPKSTESPIPYETLKEVSLKGDFAKKLFFDAIFNPYETQFLKNAKKLGADIQGGTEMMIYQGVRAFELWTGKKVSRKSVAEAKKMLRKHLLKVK